MDDLKEKFYTVIPGLKDQLYDELVREGFFKESPQATRRKYMFLGVGLLFVAGILSFVVILPFLSDWMASSICLSISLSATPLLLIVFGRQMPAKTEKGSLEAAKWRAFRNYLANIEKYTNLQEAKDIFDKYLAYATVFGLERSWVSKFAQVGTPQPRWYETYPPIILMGHPYYGQRGIGGSAAARRAAWPAGPPSPRVTGWAAVRRPCRA